MTPSEEVLDLFAVPSSTTPLPGGQGHSVVAGDLVLSPDRDPDMQAWLSPLLARLAVTMDTRPGRTRRDLRLAVPVPARDGSWVVQGWAASRYEPDTVACHDLDVTLAAGRVLHAELASWVPERPEALGRGTGRYAEAERVAFGEATHVVEGLAAEVTLHLEPWADHPSQLVHADLEGNVLLDAHGAPVVIDFSPAWRPARWAEAVCVLDAVTRGDAPLTVVLGVDRQAMLRALLFRVLSDPFAPPPAYRAVLDAITAR